ncbi:lasso peptide biosynthesis B2 protein [Nocardiopsis sp. FIRDI 009]|uniref:lasso peptide biosynthesis B2 protein n=1 Tax=Nocardiopsis sp. FIRDI 009 TaxID=714197 RepID=UPI0021047AAE|nr:lasso peptide biosynthesis B2 protein [Nocardiopsis sp. FIRDI 009]
MWGTAETSAVLTNPKPVPTVWRLAAVPAVAMTAAVLFCGSRSTRFARMVRLACAGHQLWPASHAQARYAVHAVRWVSVWAPVRWACLEESAAAAVLLAMAGRRAEWRHGIATDPVRLHAWIADPSGMPVAEPTSTDLYIVTFTPDGPPPQGMGTHEENTVD